MHRRQFLQTSALSLMVAGIGAGSLRRARAEAGPIKIGLLSPLTGVVAAGGKRDCRRLPNY